MKNNQNDKNAVLYCRVSTEKQAKDGESLETQEKINRGIAKAKDLNILPNGEVFKETFTGSKMERPIFDEMMRFIKVSSVQIDYLIVRDIDRLTRGGAGDYQKIKKELGKFGVELIDSYGFIQPAVNSLAHTGQEFDWSKRSPIQMAETFKAEMASDERSTILTRLIGAEILLTQKGFHVGRPDEGFVNIKTNVDGKKRPIQIACPERSKFVVRMFELRSGGMLVDKDIVEQLNAMGYRTRKSNKWNKEHTKIIGHTGDNLLTVKQFQKIIKKPVYCGFTCKKWTNFKLVKSQYDGLVSINTFNKANKGKVYIEDKGDENFELLHNYHPHQIIQKRSKYNPLFPYKEIVLCPTCNKPFLGSSPSGKSGKGFPTYHCARGHKYFGVKKKTFDDNFESVIKELNVDTRRLKAIEVALRSVYKSRKEEVEEFSDKVEDNIEILKKKQETNLDTLKMTNSNVVRRKLEKDVEKLEEQIIKAEEQKKDNKLSTGSNLSDFLKYAKYLMEHHEEILLNGDNPILRKHLMSLVFDSFPTYDDIVNGTPEISFIFAKQKEMATAISLSVARRGIEPLLHG